LGWCLDLKLNFSDNLITQRDPKLKQFYQKIDSDGNFIINRLFDLELKKALAVKSALITKVRIDEVLSCKVSNHHGIYGFTKELILDA